MNKKYQCHFDFQEVSGGAIITEYDEDAGLSKARVTMKQYTTPEQTARLIELGSNRQFGQK